jgi:YVTN family beta-propeller protein
VPVGKRVWGLDISRDGSLLYTADGVSSTVSVVDTKTLKNIKTIEVGKFPWGVVIDD